MFYESENLTYHQYFKTEYPGVARKTHVCDWCGEEIEIGDSYQIVKRGGSGHTVRTKYHDECIDAWDQANLHTDSEWFTPVYREQERGKYACPNAASGESSCGLCCETPFRQLLRGDEKPALKELRDRQVDPTSYYVRTEEGKLFSLQNEHYWALQRTTLADVADTYMAAKLPFIAKADRMPVWLAIPLPEEYQPYAQ